MTNCFKNRYTLQVSNDTVAFCLDVIVSSFHLVLSLLNIFVVSSSKEALFMRILLVYVNSVLKSLLGAFINIQNAPVKL